MAVKIVTIGGGSGTSVINESLLLAGAKFIKSIVTVMDSGGTTGRMRIDSEGKEIAYSDALRTLLSLKDSKELSQKQNASLVELLRKRNSRGQDLGYFLFSQFWDCEEKGFGDVQGILEKLTGVKFKGEIIPVTLRSTNISFETKMGRVYKGEHELDDKRMSADLVWDMWLEPSVPAYSGAIKAILGADILVFCCGSLYGSVLCNFLPTGVKKALKETQAKKVLVTNLASTRNETHEFKPIDFVSIFKKYTGLTKPIDVLVVPEMTRTEFEKKYPKVAKRYASEHSFFLGWDEKELSELKRMGVKVLIHKATVVEPKFLTLRHDPEKLAKSFKSLLQL